MHLGAIATPGAMVCVQPKNGLNPGTPGIWNPLPYFDTVQTDGQLGNIQPLKDFFSAAASSTCGLPNVSWITSNGTVSEHPPALISTGQSYVTRMINAIMKSPCWGSTAIFGSWGDWGGFYDQSLPQVVDQNGYGFRVPRLVISPYAKPGYVDPQVLSHDAYLKSIEDDFLGSQRICVVPPANGTTKGTNAGRTANDGSGDNRPIVRESTPRLGDLAKDFNFSQTPLRGRLRRGATPVRLGSDLHCREITP